MLIPVLITCGLALWHRPALVLDFSVDHSLSRVEWPKDWRHNEYDLGGNRYLTLRLSGGREYHDFVTNIYCMRDGAVIRYVEADTGPVTLDEACQKLRELAQYWGATVVGLDEWKVQAKHSQPPTPIIFGAGTHMTKEKPEIFISIAPAVATPDRPWHVMFQVYWMKTN